LHQEIEGLTAEKNQIVGEYSDYKVKIERVFAEVQRLHQILENIKLENADLKKENAELKKANADLIKENGEVKRDVL
jgi:regulator of replication initiation timing